MVKRNKQQKRKQRKPRQQQRRSRNNAKRTVPAAAKLLLNPCKSALVPGLHSTSEGILSRFQTFTDLGATETNGYILWCPHYVSKTSTVHETCFAWQNADASVEPFNTVTIPYGVSNAGTALALNVGASSFVSTNTCADFRLLSACMKLTYTGAINAAAGLVAPITGIPVDTLLQGSSTGRPISVDHLFSLCDDVKRMSLDTIEVRHRPDQALVDSFKSDDDAIITKGVSATNASTLSSEAKRFNPTVFGFAWKGVPAATLTASFVQNIEWRPDGPSGIVMPPPRQLHAPGYSAKLLKYLDDNFDGWQSASMGFVKSIAATYIQRNYAPTNLLM